MNYIADFHIHSAYSRATSKASNLAGLYAWARAKGINLIGTGDFTHPGWFQQLKENLIPAKLGFFKLRDENVPPALPQLFPEEGTTRFILTAEISSIYKRHGQVRKVHNILFAPDFRSAEKINHRLAAIGNIESDGRPILGLDSRNLLEIVLEEAPGGFLVPAHIWTPWFSLFGSKSGFDSIDDCFGDLTEHIFALETGLSSDPDMNRLISDLDRFTLISNSDCHSPSKLGREVNLFNTDFDFYSMKEALKDPLKGFNGTVEFFPEEGKYHMDGHRKCNVSLDPKQTRELNGICPACGKPVTVGVSHRVMELADRQKPLYPVGSPTYKSLIPLQEVLSEIIGIGPNTKGVLTQYHKMINTFGSEFTLLLNTPEEEIKQSSPILAEAIKRIRNNQVIRKAGFDGEFGVIHVFEPGELSTLSGQKSLFPEKPKGRRKKKKEKVKTQSLPLLKLLSKSVENSPVSNPEQQRAIKSDASRILIAAGPGTGKTYTLISRLLFLLRTKKIPAEKITAITFTNRAADEMKERLASKAEDLAYGVFVGTFHRFCLDWLRKEKELEVVGQEERELLLKNIFPEKSAPERKQLSQTITHSFLAGFQKTNEENKSEAHAVYLSELRRKNGIDLEEIISFFVHQLHTDSSFAQKVCSRVKYLFVDEFQDVNTPQYELISFLAQSAHIFGIGDPDQAIYGFRGSDLNFFFQFGNASSTEKLLLTKNYRSAATILKAASAVIRHNSVKSNITLHPHRENKGDIRLFKAPSPQAEAEYIVKKIEKVLGGVSSFSMNSGRSDGEQTAYSFQDIGICYRLSRQAVPLAEALQRRGIPFQLVGATPFFMKPDIRALYYWIVIASGEDTLGNFILLCKEIPGIGQATIELLESSLTLHSNDFFIGACEADISTRAIRILKQVAQEFENFRNGASDNIAQVLRHSFTIFNLDPSSKNGQRLLELSEAFGSLAALAKYVMENRTATVYDDHAEAVSLMTLHSTKGLEFPIVFITGCEEGIIPHQAKDTDLEEERRLFYVGMTRAKDQLFLTYTEGHKLCRFVREIPAEYITEEKYEKRNRKKPGARQLKLF